jgi:hypothetical protein
MADLAPKSVKRKRRAREHLLTPDRVGGARAPMDRRVNALRGAVVAAAIAAMAPGRAAAQAPRPPPGPPPATPGPECADERVGGVCDDPSRLALIEAHRAEHEAALSTEGGVFIGAAAVTGLAATGLGIYSLTAPGQSTGYYVGGGVVTGMGALIGVSILAALATLSEPERPTTRAWEARIADADNSGFFTLWLATPAILTALAVVPLGIWIMADPDAAPTAPDAKRVSLGAGSALLGTLVLVGVGIGVAQQVRFHRIIRAIEPPRPKTTGFTVGPALTPVLTGPGAGATLGIGGTF